MIYSSPVIRGRGEGRRLGYPTLNLVIPSEFEFKPGVYVSRLWIGDEEYTGALHYGPIPTFGQNELSLEIHVLDFNNTEEIDSLSFEITHYLRPILSFNNSDDLKAQISADLIAVRKLSHQQANK